MNGCLIEEQEGSEYRGSRIVMYVFKEKNREVVITIPFDSNQRDFVTMAKETLKYLD